MTDLQYPAEQTTLLEAVRLFAKQVYTGVTELGPSSKLSRKYLPPMAEACDTLAR